MLRKLFRSKWQAAMIFCLVFLYYNAQKLFLWPGTWGYLILISICKGPSFQTHAFYHRCQRSVIFFSICYHCLSGFLLSQPLFSTPPPVASITRAVNQHLFPRKFWYRGEKLTLCHSCPQRAHGCCNWLTKPPCSIKVVSRVLKSFLQVPYGRSVLQEVA